MKFKVRDKVKIRKNVTLEEIARNYFNGSQSSTMNFLRNASFDSFEGTFIIKEIWSDNCVKLDNGFLINTIILDKVEEILDDKEKEYLSSVIKPYRNKIRYIVKIRCFNDEKEFICIDLCNDSCTLPSFKKGTMYKNMKVNKEYSLEELGLNE